MVAEALRSSARLYLEHDVSISEDKEKIMGLLTIMQSTLSKVMVESTLSGPVSAKAATKSTDVQLWIKLVLTKISQFTHIQWVPAAVVRSILNRPPLPASDNYPPTPEPSTL